MNKNSSVRGFSLVELMVALIIGSFLIIGAVTVYVQSRNTYSVNETVARLQENARYAMSMLEPDIRQASFWGLSNDPWLIEGAVGSDAPLSVALSNSCGLNFTLDLRQPLAATNADYTLSCPETPAGSASAAADTLIVRRADEQPGVANAQRVQIYSVFGGSGSRVFSAGAPPGQVIVDPILGPRQQIHDLIVRAYYVSQTSSTPGVPALRRKTLVQGPGYQDDEILPGVEDLQVQFGVEQGVDRNGDGVADLFTGTAESYVNADAVGSAQIVSVRLWLLVRAERPEVGFTDNRAYNYADVVNYQPNDAFRRLLVSRTIQIRNTANLQS